MSINMDEAARLLRERLGSSAPKAGTHTSMTGETIVINNITNHGAGHVTVGLAPRRRWWQSLFWAALVVAAFLTVAYSISSASAAELAGVAIVCDSFAGEDGQLRTSCVAARARPAFLSFHASLTDEVLTALTSAANACIEAFYPPSSGLIHDLPGVLTSPVGSQPAERVIFPPLLAP